MQEVAQSGGIHIIISHISELEKISNKYQTSLQFLNLRCMLNFIHLLCRSNFTCRKLYMPIFLLKSNRREIRFGPYFDKTYLPPPPQCDRKCDRLGLSKDSKKCFKDIAEPTPRNLFLFFRIVQSEVPKFSYHRERGKLRFYPTLTLPRKFFRLNPFVFSSESSEINFVCKAVS